MSLPRSYIPAFRFHLLTRLYDPFVVFAFGRVFKRIVSTVRFQDGQNVLDVACGPGNLLLAVHQKNPSLKLVGLDIDPEILAIAKHKTAAFPKNLLSFVEASATNMPFPNEHFDVVTSSLAFHHLTPKQKRAAFREIHRVLKPGGRFWLYDFASPVGFWGALFSKVYRFFEEIDDQIGGILPRLFKDAGFESIQTHWTTRGIFSLISAKKM